MPTVHVTGISETTTEQQLKDYFTFCGLIESIDFQREKQSAQIHFAKPSAAKTALMLNGGTLNDAHLTITGDGEDVPHDDGHQEGHIEQSDKPRAGIAAEYLARGYTLSDNILQRAIELDNKHGISSRFLSYIQSLDTTIGAKALGPEKTVSGKVQETIASATQQAKAVDEQRGISKTANDYYTRALGSPWGQKVKVFYTTTSKQVFDIHDEARRIAETHKNSATPSSTATGTSAPPTDGNIHSVSTADPTTAGDSGTTEAPTVV